MPSRESAAENAPIAEIGFPRHDIQAAGPLRLMGRVLLNAILGPPLGGAIIVVLAFIHDGGRTGETGARVPLLMLGYLIGIVPALVNGILAGTIAHFFGRPWRLSLAPLTGAAATGLFGALMFGHLVEVRVIAFVSLVGALASLACALLAEVCPARHRSAGDTEPKQ